MKTRIHLNVLIKTGECFSDACLPASAYSDEAAASHFQLLLNITAKIKFLMIEPSCYFLQRQLLINPKVNKIDFVEWTEKGICNEEKILSHLDEIYSELVVRCKEEIFN